MTTPFYITTPIYYVNDKPHIGHCYTTLLADIAARFERLSRGSGSDVFFLTGTDEHADKVVTSAIANNTTPQEWADRNAEQFRIAFDFMGCTQTDFIRTTEPRHKHRVPEYIASLLASGAIYKGDYTGWYDEGQEEYVTETAAKDADFKSTISGRPLVKRTEPCYFFRLGNYQQRLHDLIASDTFKVSPGSRKNEVLGRLKPPAVLNDVPISRPVTSDPATQWGIRIPGDDANRVYVWIDALFNYLTVVDTPERRRFWPAQVHLIGKDILWFHAVIWPALLIALKESSPNYSWVNLPREVFGHGWWISEGQKMSKSLGNFISIDNLREYAAKHGIDALRWFLATQGPLSGVDADFSHAKFIETYNADLANTFGNSVSRVGNMIEKYFGGTVPDAKGRHRFTFSTTIDTTPAVPLDPAVTQETVYDWPVDTAEFVSASAARARELDLGEALNQGIGLVARVDGFINTTQPFKLAKTVDADPNARQKLAEILYCCAESLRIASLLLSPAMPEKCAQVWRAWNCTPANGIPLAQLAVFGGSHALKAGAPLSKGEILFMRAEMPKA